MRIGLQRSDRRLSPRAVLVAVALLACSAPHAAWGAPLDVSDLTSRSIVVEVPGTSLVIPSSYGPRMVGGMPSATEGELVISAGDYESYLAEAGDSPGGVPIPGSFSDVTLVIDIATLAVTGDPITGQVDIMIGPPADLVRTLGTGLTAGFQDVQIAPGFFVTIFCAGPTVFGPCTIVPGSSYDPGTGEFTMVGDDTLDHPDITDPRFAKFFASNTFRLREAPFGVPSLAPWAIAGLVITLAVTGRASPRRFSMISSESPGLIR